MSKENVYGLDELTSIENFRDSVRFDVTPDILFKSRFITPETKEQAYRETHGFMFYIDYMEDVAPTLMLMKTKELRSSTVGRVEGVPVGLLEAAVNREGVKDYCGMYPLDDALTSWLKERLQITG